MIATPGGKSLNDVGCSSAVVSLHAVRPRLKGSGWQPTQTTVVTPPGREGSSSTTLKLEVPPGAISGGSAVIESTRRLSTSVSGLKLDEHAHSASNGSARLTAHLAARARGG